jgi:hypothetical protein
MNALTSILLTCGCVFTGSALAASTCYDTLTETTIIDNFTLLSNGLVQDKNTGLMWMRCAHGQTFDSTNSTCTGSPVQITWQDALQLSETINDGGYTDWRVPNAKELATIVEKRCVDPSVNEIVFPATSAENFWSSTTVVGTETSAWSVAFYNGKNNTKDKLLDLHVRFIRYAE